jgi:hypothetical protein
MSGGARHHHDRPFSLSFLFASSVCFYWPTPANWLLPDMCVDVCVSNNLI